ncbi:hypothetical protein MKAN_01420 [Mycobacterium kansasii ATCC 12478]|uniref:Uncharacterized protein n=1 Tax=Mycobacterium kansasii ATCC 12478 TaxID=557599 RepID=U5X167_MYCKA|nr:hypothetical protein MKAN_01420 [Mycobacterium kansasii ATCC 12478]
MLDWMVHSFEIDAGKNPRDCSGNNTADTNAAGCQ